MSAVLSRRGSLLAVLAALAMAFAMALVVFASSASAQEVGVCHAPPGNPENAHWIGPDEESFPAHVAHGDETSTEEECEGTDTTGTDTTGTGTTGTDTTGTGTTTGKMTGTTGTTGTTTGTTGTTGKT